LFLQEANILQLGEKYREEGKTKEMTDLIAKVRTFLKYMSKAKAAKLVRGLVDMFLDMRKEGETGEKEVQLCKVRLVFSCNRFYQHFLENFLLLGISWTVLKNQ